MLVKMAILLIFLERSCNMMNYIYINGRCIDLTPEALDKIKAAINEEPESTTSFNRQYNQQYYFIDMNGQIRSNLEKK